MESTTNPYMDPNDCPWTDEYIESHRPRWLKDDDSDRYIFEDALFGVV